MSINLNPTDHQGTIHLIQNLPEFTNVRDRRRLVESIFEGIPQGEVILGSIDLDGSPRSAAAGLVVALRKFGQFRDGSEALGVFLNQILHSVGKSEADYIQKLLTTYQLDIPSIPLSPLGKWLGNETPEVVQEQIVGENTLQHIRILELALDAAKSVILLRTPHGSGTGFVVGDNLIMTNNHVIETSDEAKATDFIFNFQLDKEGNECDASIMSGAVCNTFHTNDRLDYTIFDLRDTPSFVKPLTISNRLSKSGERVAIIQHAGGHYKQISFQNNFVQYADGNTVQYTTSTLAGSSGSPVFDPGFNVVAIHHSGVRLRDPGTQHICLRNAGTSMKAILQDIMIHAPIIYDKIKTVA